MKRRYWAFGLLVLIATSFESVTRADDMDACSNSIADLAISGCSALIDAGTDTRKNIFLAHVRRGDAYASRGELDLAIEDYDKAVILCPTCAASFAARGLAYGRKGELSRAFKDLDKAIEIDSKYANAYFYRGGIYLSKMKDFNQAIKEFDKDIALNPKHAAAYWGRGLAYENLENEPMAEADYKKVLLLDPENKIAAEALQRLKSAP
jgi:tetratricopeptide (TPR) repeat protein